MIVFTFYSVLHILGDEHQMDDTGSWESNYQSFIRGGKDSNNILVVSLFSHFSALRLRFYRMDHVFSLNFKKTF